MSEPPPPLSPTRLVAKVQRRGFSMGPSTSAGAGPKLAPDVSTSRVKGTKPSGQQDVMQQIAAGTTVNVGAGSAIGVSKMSMSSSRSSSSGRGAPPVGLTQDQVSAAMEMADNALMSVSDVVPSPKKAAPPPKPEGAGGGSRKDMDLSNNDNAFHVIANLVLDKFKNGKTELTQEDRQQLDTTLPPSVRLNFVEAVRYRLSNDCPPGSQKNIHVMTRKCGALGLAKQEDENPLLLASPSKVAIVNMPTVQQNSNGSTIQSLPHEDDTKEQHSISASGRFSKIGLPPTHNADRVIPTSIPQNYKHTDESTVSVGSILTGGSMSEAHVSTTESLARQQLMAELREASNLMASSVTPEAAQFWRNHVVDLQARLRALHGETPVPEGGTLSEENKALLSQYKNSFPGSDQANSFSPASQATDGYTSHASAFQPAPEATQSDYYETSRGFQATEGRYEPPRQKKGGAIAPRQSGQNEPRESGLPMVDVVAPADLPGGYHFEAEIEGRRFLATVPDGGVRKGQAFSCLMRDLETVGADVPLGRWRDRLCDCTKFGMTHPALLNGLFCPLLALGQVMTRVNFDFAGRPILAKKRSNAYKTMWLIIMFWILMNISIWFGFNYKWSKKMPLSIEDYLAVTLLNVSGVIFAIYATMNTRAGLREKYMIREYRCYDVEDLCCATFCLPCTVCQMARHTASYDHVGANCCTDTGVVAKNNNVVSESGEGSFV